MVTILSILGGLVGLHLFYFFVIVPFQYWVGSKIEADYDPGTNRFRPTRARAEREIAKALNSKDGLGLSVETRESMRLKLLKEQYGYDGGDT